MMDNGIKIETRIVASPARSEHAERLASITGGQVYMDWENEGAKWNHLNALRTPAGKDTTHLLIIEDDSDPVDAWLAKVKKVIALYPEELVSLYLGTGRPVSWQERVDAILVNQPTIGFLRFSDLFHGVAYIVPTGVADLTEVFSQPVATPAADFAVGRLWLRATGKKDIIYSARSIFDHLDQPPVKGDSRPYIERRARRLWM